MNKTKAYQIKYIDGTEITVYADNSRTIVGTVEGLGLAGKMDRAAGKADRGLYLSTLVHLSELMEVIESQNDYYPNPYPNVPAC